MTEKKIDVFFFAIFTLIPLSIIIGDTVSLINILLINIFFLFFFFKKNINLQNRYSLIFFLLFYLYLIFNSFIAIESELTISRNIGFLRFIILFIFINYFYNYFVEDRKTLDFWTCLILVVITDIYVEFFFGKNLFGWGARFIDGIEQPDGRRIVSFFKDEPIVGAYLSGFIFLIFGYLTTKFSSKKFIPFLFLILAYFAIFFTGERSNAIKILLGILIFFSLTDYIDFKRKILLFCLFLSIIFFFYKNSDFLGNRYHGILNNFNSKDKIINQYENNIYFKLYKSGYNVYKNSPLVGVGNKNYRIISCEYEKRNALPLDYKCLTHPHQIYFEFLSEHGLIGTIIILCLIFYIMFKVLIEIIRSKNQIQLCCFIYILVQFIPLLPSGSFFTDFNATLFWLNFSIMIAANKKTNIFGEKLKI